MNGQFAVTNQIGRSVVSISSNIAEGKFRKSNLEFKRFLEISLGSACELETQLLSARNIGYLDDEKFDILQEKLQSIILMTSKFKSTLNQ